MSDDEVFAVSARHRRAFADLIESLDETRLATPSLCHGWDVRTVAAHLVSALTTGRGAFLLAVIRARGNLDRMVDRAARETARRPVAELVATLRDTADSRFAPPVVGPYGPMTDALVHTGDVTVPLGLPFDPAPADVAIALEFVLARTAPGFTTKARTSGLRFVADDARTAHGDGAEVRGRGIDVLLAACGRPAVLDRLSGDGVGLLRSRIA